MFLSDTFGSCVWAYCRQNNLSLRTFAEASGVSASTLSRVIQGKSVTLETFSLLCDTMNQNPALFFTSNPNTETQDEEIWRQEVVAALTSAFHIPMPVSIALRRLLEVMENEEKARASTT